MKSSEIYMCAKSIKTIWMKFWTETPPPFFVVSLFLQEIMDLTSFEIVKNNHHASLNKGGSNCRKKKSTVCAILN